MKLNTGRNKIRSGYKICYDWMIINTESSLDFMYLVKQLDDYYDREMWILQVIEEGLSNDQSHRYLFVPYLLSSEKYVAKYARIFPEDRHAFNLADYITTGGRAYTWARTFPEDRLMVRQHITEDHTLWWTHTFPEDHEIMKDRIKSSGPAYRWGIKYPEDKADMKPLVTNDSDIVEWIKAYPDDYDEMIDRVDSEFIKQKIEMCHTNNNQ